MENFCEMTVIRPEDTFYLKCQNTKKCDKSIRFASILKITVSDVNSCGWLGIHPIRVSVRNQFFPSIVLSAGEAPNLRYVISQRENCENAVENINDKI